MYGFLCTFLHVHLYVYANVHMLTPNVDSWSVTGVGAVPNRMCIPDLRRRPVRCPGSGYRASGDGPLADIRVWGVRVLGVLNPEVIRVESLRFRVFDSNFRIRVCGLLWRWRWVCGLGSRRNRHISAGYEAVAPFEFSADSSQNKFVGTEEWRFALICRGLNN